ncbi:MAG: hypothetical protein Q9187_006127 [Circinaria calcarea]
MASQVNGQVDHDPNHCQNHCPNYSQNPVPNHVPGVKKPAKLILCFDGTGNKFTGTPEDTNIVKLYQKFDREAADQYHYYQPGIGTYAAGEASLNAGVFGRFQRWLSKTVDLAVGTTFDQHVIAGYRFIMRYYSNHDHIYMFGFSRGAFTARFLARMISHVGLLSMGNEEMVPFAYQAYQDYVMGTGHKTPEEAERFMIDFKTTFCRTYAQVHFLGLFDTVSSVGYFDLPFQKKFYASTVLRTAAHVRHAVSIDERRMKFKPALLAQDKQKDKALREEADTKNSEHDHHIEYIIEKFFPGNHGDVGGGWSPNPATRHDLPGVSPNHPSRLCKVPECLAKLDDLERGDPVQLSDIALQWMIKELDEVEEFHPEARIAWNHHRCIFMENIGNHLDQATTAEIHDLLQFGGWSNWKEWPKTLMWQIAEWCPLFKRKELNKNGEEVDQYFPPNMGGTRNIPAYNTKTKYEQFHSSVARRIQLTNPSKLNNHSQPAARPYRPQNNGIQDFVKFVTKTLDIPDPQPPLTWPQWFSQLFTKGRIQL